jgi:hypothetical protein
MPNYGAKYFLEFADMQAVVYRLTFLEIDYVGNMTEVLAGAEPFVADVQTDEKYGGIIGTVFNINVVSQPQDTIYDNPFEVENLFKTSEDDLIIELRQNPDTSNELIHKGYISAFKSRQSIRGHVQPFQIVAGCGLGRLKNEPFRKPDGKPYKGLMSYLSILQICLSKTGLDLPFSVCLNIIWEEFNHLSEGAALDACVYAEAYLDSNELPLSCKEVLNDILDKFNCEIFQERGFYVLRNVDMLLNDDCEIKQYQYDGTFLGTLIVNPHVVVNDDVFYTSGDSTYGFEPTIKTFTASVNNQGKRSLLKNGDFSSRMFGVLTDWGTIPADNAEFGNQLTLLPEGIRISPGFACGFDTSERYLDEIPDDPFANVMQTPYLDCNFIDIYNKGSIKTIDAIFKWASLGSDLCFQIMIKTAGDQYFYYTRDKQWSFDVTSMCYHVFNGIHVSTVIEESTVNIDFTGMYTSPNVLEKVINIGTMGLQIPKYLFVRICKPIKINASLGIEIKSVKINISDNDVRNGIGEHIVTNKIKSNSEKKEYTCLTGEYSFEGYDTDTMYLGNVYTPLGKPIKYWRNTPNVNDFVFNIFQLTLIQRAKQYSVPFCQFEGDIIGQNTNDFLGFFNTVRIRNFIDGIGVGSEVRIFKQLHREYSYKYRLAKVILQEMIRN